MSTKRTWKQCASHSSAETELQTRSTPSVDGDSEVQAQRRLSHTSHGTSESSVVVPEMRDNHESTWLLLFFDLFYVALAIQVGHSMKHSMEHSVLLADDALARSSIVLHLLIFLAFFCIWVDTQIYFSRVPLASVRDLVLFLIELLGAFGMLLALGAITTAEHLSRFNIHWNIFLTGLGISRGSNLIAWACWWRAQSDEDPEWALCQWTVRVKCGSALGLLALWASLYLRNLLIGLAGANPRFEASTELTIAVATLVCLLLELVARAWPGSPGEVQSVHTLDKATRSEMIKRCGEFTMLFFGEPIIQLSVSATTPQCQLLTYTSSKFIAIPIIFCMALLYFGAQPTQLKRHVLARSRPAAVLWLVLHGLLGFSLIVVSAALSTGLDDVAASRVGLGVCQHESGFCECQLNRPSCLSMNHSSGGCAWVTCNANVTSGRTAEFCAALLPGAASTSCFLEVERQQGTVSQFFAPSWTPFPFVQRPDPRASVGYWEGRGDGHTLGGSGHHGARDIGQDGEEAHEAGPEVWPWVLVVGLAYGRAPLEPPPSAASLCRRAACSALWWRDDDVSCRPVGAARGCRCCSAAVGHSSPRGHCQRTRRACPRASHALRCPGSSLVAALVRVVNLEILALRYTHFSLEATCQRYWLGLGVRVLLCCLPLVVALGVVSEAGARLLCSSEPPPGTFHTLAAFYATLLAIELTLVSADIASNILQRLALERQAYEAADSLEDGPIRPIRGPSSPSTTSSVRWRLAALPFDQPTGGASASSGSASYAATARASVYFSQSLGPAVSRLSPGFRPGTVRASALRASGISSGLMALLEGPVLARSRAHSAPLPGADGELPPDVARPSRSHKVSQSMRLGAKSRPFTPTNRSVKFLDEDAPPLVESSMETSCQRLTEASAEGRLTDCSSSC